MNAASPTLGENMFVPALTTVFLGATYGKIGVFNVPGTLVGAVLYALINQGLLMITGELWLKNYVQGGMLHGGIGYGSADQSKSWEESINIWRCRNDKNCICFRRIYYQRRCRRS